MFLQLSARVGYIGTIHFGRERETGWKEGVTESEREKEEGRAEQHTLSNTDKQQHG